MAHMAVMLEAKENQKRAIVGYVNEFSEEHGYPPSIVDLTRYLKRRFGQASVSSTRRYVDELCEEGYLKRDAGIKRSLRVTGKNYQEPVKTA